MQLKLFRSTGYHSILAPGEARLAPHPAWAVAAVAAWVGFACNAWLWRALAGGGEGLQRAALLGVAITSMAAALLSLLGWRRTFKLAATLVLLLAALVAAGTWVNDVTAVALSRDGFRLASLLPPWASLFRWQVPAALVVLGFVPVLVLANTKLRRLSGPQQTSVNVRGLILWGLLAAAAIWLLGRLPA